MHGVQSGGIDLPCGAQMPKVARDLVSALGRRAGILASTSRKPRTRAGSIGKLESRKPPMLPRLTALGFDVLALQHAEAILNADMPAALTDLETVLSGLEIPIEEIIMGGEAPSTQRMRSWLEAARWT